VRPTKLGAKNYLFFGSSRGGELAAAAYTLIKNCKLQGLNFRSYLTETMRTIVEQGPAHASELTPQAIVQKFPQSSDHLNTVNGVGFQSLTFVCQNDFSCEHYPMLSSPFLPHFDSRE